MLHVFRVFPKGEREDFPLARVVEADEDTLVLSARDVRSVTGESTLRFILTGAIFDKGENLPQVTRNLFVSIVDVLLGDGSRVTVAEHPPE